MNVHLPFSFSEGTGARDATISRQSETINLEQEKFMAIRWDKFTIKAQEAIQQANDLAGQHGNPEMLPLHLLAGLLQDSEGIVAPVVAKLGVNSATLQSQGLEIMERLPIVCGASAQPHLSAAMSKLLDEAFKEADTF